MRLLLLVLLLSSLAQAAQIALRQGETGRLGARQIEVLQVQNRRCGPTENCVAPVTVTARVRLREGAQTSLLRLQLPPTPLPRWSGVGVAKITGGAAPQVTLTDQPPSSRKPAQHVTLKRGERGQLGPRQVKLLGFETRRCPPTILCLRPAITFVYVQVHWGQNRSWLALEFPAPPAWPGVTLVSATAGPNPALTFSGQRR